MKINEDLSKLSIIALFTVLSAVFATPVFAGGNFSYTTQAQNTGSTPDSLQGRVIYVPAGSVTTVMLSNCLSSETSTIGMPVNATLTNDFIYNGKLIAGRGSSIRGTIIKAKKAGHAGKNGQIQVVFNTITTSEGYSIPVNAVFKTDDNTGILKGGTKLDTTKDYAKNAVVGASAGAALGTAMGAMSGGSVGKGAIYGTALGGGIGLAKAVVNKGEDVSVPASAYLDIYFTQPITLSAPSEYKYEY